MANKRQRKKALAKAKKPLSKGMTKAERELNQIMRAGKKLTFKEAYGISRKAKQEAYKKVYVEDILKLEEASKKLELEHAEKEKRKREQFTTNVEVTAFDYYANVVNAYIQGFQTLKTQTNQNLKMTNTRKAKLNEFESNIDFIINYIKDMVADLGVTFVGQWINRAVANGLIPTVSVLYKAVNAIQFIEEFERIAPQDIDEDVRDSFGSAESDINDLYNGFSAEEFFDPETGEYL